MPNPFRYFNSSPEVIRLAVMMDVRYPLSLRQVEDLLFERGIDICHETVRFWWSRFGPMFAAAIRKRRVHHRLFSLWRWHLDEVFVQVGDVVSEGDTLGSVGETGSLSGPSLYFEIRHGSQPEDPAGWFAPQSVLASPQ